MNVTGTGVAVALAVVIAVGLLFFAPQVLTMINQQPTTTDTATQPTTTMQDQDPTTNTDASSTAQKIPDATQLMGKDLVVGTGAEAKAGDKVTVDYVGMFTDGKVFDASKSHGNDGFTFTLGAGQVIKGWDQGVQGMKVGGKRELIIPPTLGYGSQTVGPIPANSTLVFEVDLLKVGQ